MLFKGSFKVISRYVFFSDAIKRLYVELLGCLVSHEGTAFIFFPEGSWVSNGLENDSKHRFFVIKLNTWVFKDPRSHSENSKHLLKQIETNIFRLNS